MASALQVQILDKNSVEGAGGDKYFEMLERDIGVQRGYFKEQAAKFVFEE